jgi:hypothetical protein
MSLCDPGTLATFSKFCLNTSKSTNKSCAESPGTHFIIRVTLLVLSGKGDKLPRKLRITVHLGHKNRQVGIWISLSIWIQFKFGFSHILEDQLIYNFPIYKYWSLHVTFRELCKKTGAHRMDRAENTLGAMSRARDATRRRHATAVRCHATAGLEVCAWARLTSASCAHSETRPRPGSRAPSGTYACSRGAVRAPAAHARRGPPYPA